MVKGAESTSKSRVAVLQKNVAAMGLQHGVWLSKKAMKVVHHAEKMVVL